MTASEIGIEKKNNNNTFNSPTQWVALILRTAMRNRQQSPIFEQKISHLQKSREASSEATCLPKAIQYETPPNRFQAVDEGEKKKNITFSGRT